MTMRLPILSFPIFFALGLMSDAEVSPSFATGIKIGEVTQTEAIIWVRLCDSGNEPKGAPGRVRISCWPEQETEKRVDLEAAAVDADKDFTAQVKLSELIPNTGYRLSVQAISENGVDGEALRGHFKTAPTASQIADVTGVVVTCQGHNTIDSPKEGHWAYSHMLTHNPDLFVHTGDVVYYDKGGSHPLSKTVALARERWNDMFAYSWNRDFHSRVSSYFMKDDHDTLMNDCWPGQSYGEISWKEGLALFSEQTPQGELPYRNVRWGQDLELWFIEGRDYRSRNDEPDGPDKTILGEEQKAWLKETLQASDATFKLVFFPSPVVGPDKKGKFDNHSNPNFAHEGNELREFFSKISNAFVVCGDRHWQYGSKDPVTGLVEICCGPINNEHAKLGGNAERNDDYHLYFGGGKGGYLRFEVTRENNTPQISFIWHGDQSSNGAINHQLTYQATVTD